MTYLTQAEFTERAAKLPHEAVIAAIHATADLPSGTSSTDIVARALVAAEPHIVQAERMRIAGVLSDKVAELLTGVVVPDAEGENR